MTRYADVMRVSIGVPTNTTAALSDGCHMLLAADALTWLWVWSYWHEVHPRHHEESLR